MVFVILNVQNDEKIGFRHISATVGYLSAFPFHLQARKLKALMESVRMYCVQPVQPTLGLRPIGLVYCNPSLLGYIMKVTPPD
jgi:hypothetical protein